MKKISQDEINNVAWKACDTFRGTIDPAQYKDYILVMLFLKYLSDVWKDKKEEYEKEFKGDQERVARRLARERFILPDGCDYYTLYTKRNEANIGELINVALEQIEDANKAKLEGVFRNIDFNSEANLGQTKERNKRLKHLLEDFADERLDLRPSVVGKQDIIGNTYQYLIGRFASDAGKKGGEFYTPDPVSELLAKLLAPIDFKEYEKKVQKLVDTHVKAEGVQQITAQVNIFEREQFQAEIDKLTTTASKADTIAHRTQRTITEKMDEDPVFYRKFSKVLQEAIDAYRQGRIDAVEYLKRATEAKEAVLNRTGDDLPASLKGRDEAKAFYGVVNEVYDGLALKENSVPYGTANAAADMAVQIDNEIQRRLVVDWRTNPDVQNAMRNAIEDLLYEARQAKGLPLTTPDMDAIIERALEIAKVRYAR